MSIENSETTLNSKQSPIDTLKKFELSGEYVFHGSPDKIEILKPRQPKNMNQATGQMENDGNPAVCATDDYEIAIFRAITAKAKGSTRFHKNISTGEKDFQMSKEVKNNIINNSGYVYVLDKKNFKSHGFEWRAPSDQRPIKVIEVTSNDMPKGIKEYVNSLTNKGN